MSDIDYKLVGIDKYPILYYIPISQIRSKMVKVTFSGQRSNFRLFFYFELEISHVFSDFCHSKRITFLYFPILFYLVLRPNHMTSELLSINNNNKPKFQYHFLQMSILVNGSFQILIIVIQFYGI